MILFCKDTVQSQNTQSLALDTAKNIFRNELGIQWIWILSIHQHILHSLPDFNPMPLMLHQMKVRFNSLWRRVVLVLIEYYGMGDGMHCILCVYTWCILMHFERLLHLDGGAPVTG